jgi:hypothetical protein
MTAAASAVDPPDGSLLRVSAQALLDGNGWREVAVASATIAAWMVRDDALPLAALCRAVGRCKRAIPSHTALVVQTRYTQPHDLRRLRQAGATAVEWRVPLFGDDDPRLPSLAAAVDTCWQLGLAVHLRSVVGVRELVALSSLRSGQTAELAVARWVLEPPPLPQDSPHPQILQRHWPPRTATRWQLVGSALWPPCLALAVDATEPQAGSAGLSPVPEAACRSCQLAVSGRCQGPLPPFAEVWRTADPPWQPWQAGRVRGEDAAPRTDAVRYSADCVEVRGLRLGLRQAWRLRVDATDLDAFADAATRDGWQVAASPAAVSMTVGGKVAGTPQRDGHTSHVVLVSADAALAARCLQAELEMLQPNPGDVRGAVVAMIAHHRQLGEAYGFPSCCVEAFCDAFVEVVHTRRLGDNALTLARAAARSRQFLAPLATLAGEFGHGQTSPLRHLPCRFDCAPSLDLANRLLADQAAQGRPPAALEARPALVGHDGAFVLFDGRWDEAAGAVVDITGCEIHGLPAAPPPWLRAFATQDGQTAAAAARTWTALRCDHDGVHVRDAGPASHWTRVAASQLVRGATFPLLLPFVATGTAGRS